MGGSNAFGIGNLDNDGRETFWIPIDECEVTASGV